MVVSPQSVSQHKYPIASVPHPVFPHLFHLLLVQSYPVNFNKKGFPESTLKRRPGDLKLMKASRNRLLLFSREANSWSGFVLVKKVW